MPFNLSSAENFHNLKYDYSKVDYKNVDTKVLIICPDHGEFLQTPYKHINMGQGCPKCKGVKLSKDRRFSKEQFEISAREIHGSKYNYEKVLYKNMHTNIEILCPQHGEFFQKPSNHIFDKNGCPKCGYNVSKSEDLWLDSLGISKEFRQKTIKIQDKRFKTDAYTPYNNTVYEFFGFFWHGHPDYFNPEDMNPRNKQKFGDLYKATLNKISAIENAGFNLVFTWG